MMDRLLLTIKNACSFKLKNGKMIISKVKISSLIFLAMISVIVLMIAVSLMS